VLEIQGNATGALGGTYSGVLQMSAAAVPLPPAWTFLLSGVAGLGLLARKRR
jgi:lysozyme family protein